MTYHLAISELVRRYEAGEGTSSIAKSHGVDYSVIHSRLAKAGVVFRNSSEQWKATLARDPTLRMRMGCPRKYTVNESFFLEHTADVAYVIGLLQADGYVAHSTVTLVLKASDEEHVRWIAQLLGSSHPLVRRDPVKANGGAGVGLTITSVRLAHSLHAWGVRSPKSHTARTDQRLLEDRDYWRGVIDGDGSICTAGNGRRILSLVGSRFMCAEFLAFARSLGIETGATVRPHKRIFSLHLHGRAAVDMAHVLYCDADVALRRKREQYERWAT